MRSINSFLELYFEEEKTTCDLIKIGSMRRCLSAVTGEGELGGNRTDFKSSLTTET